MQVAGVNIEDGRGDHLAAATEHANLLRAFKDAAPAIFLTARIDTHWLKLEQRTTIERAKRYADAGADGVFVPGLSDDQEIDAVAAAVELPLNVLAQGDIERLASLGVRSSQHRLAALPRAVRDGRPAPEVPTYDAVQALADR